MNRYEALTGHCIEPDGEWVKYEDYKQEVDRIKRDLRIYGSHIVGSCKLLIHSKYGCTCGLQQELEEE